MNELPCTTLTVWAAEPVKVVGAVAWTVNVPVLVGNYSFGHDAGGSVTNALPTLQNSGACGLTAINGAFRGLPTPGVRINNFGSMQWSLTLDEHVGATVSCVQPF